MLMLPASTQCLKQMQKVFGYMNTQMLEQSEFVGLKRAKRYVRAMTELCNEHIENYSEVGSSNLDVYEPDEPQQPHVQRLQESVRQRGQARARTTTACRLRPNSRRLAGELIKYI